jgi:hypothetical protein
MVNEKQQTEAPPRLEVFRRVDRLGHGESRESAIMIGGVLYERVDPKVVTELVQMAIKVLSHDSRHGPLKPEVDRRIRELLGKS